MKLKQGTYTIKFKGAPPRRALISCNGNTWIERDLDGKTDCIKFNVINDGIYTSPNYFDIVKVEPLQVRKPPIKLYKKERDLEKPVEIVYNPNLQGTPARIFAQRNPALIEIGAKFYQYPPQVRMFILLHEYGHMFYKDEHKTDLFALKMYLSLGLNASQAFYALAKVLHRSPDNIERIKKLFNELKENGYVKN